MNRYIQDKIFNPMKRPDALRGDYNLRMRVNGNIQQTQIAKDYFTNAIYFEDIKKIWNALTNGEDPLDTTRVAVFRVDTEAKEVTIDRYDSSIAIIPSYETKDELDAWIKQLLTLIDN